MEIIKSCGAIIFSENSIPRKYLIVYKHKKPYWGFSKGTSERNETPEETVKREIKEELDLDLEIITGFNNKSSYYAAKGVKSILTLLLANTKSEKVIYADGEIKKHKWLPYEDAKRMLSHQSNREALTKAEEFLNKNIIHTQERTP